MRMSRLCVSVDGRPLREELPSFNKTIPFSSFPPPLPLFVVANRRFIRMFMYACVGMSVWSGSGHPSGVARPRCCCLTRGYASIAVAASSQFSGWESYSIYQIRTYVHLHVHERPVFANFPSKITLPIRDSFRDEKSRISGKCIPTDIPGKKIYIPTRFQYLFNKIISLIQPRFAAQAYGNSFHFCPFQARISSCTLQGPTDPPFQTAHRFPSPLCQWVCAIKKPIA
jgi:hypothetical protein